MNNMDKHRRESIRWILLLALKYAWPSTAGEVLALRTVQAEFPDATSREVRGELEYLASRALVTLTKDPSGPWFGKLTRHGMDLAEYTIDCEPGIARPQKYW